MPFVPGRSEFTGVIARVPDVEADVLFVPVFGRDDRLTDLEGIDAVVDGEWTRAVESRLFTYKPYLGVSARVVRDWKASSVCFVGAGERADADGTRWRRVAAACSYLARERRARTCAWVVREGLDVAAVAAAAADGLSAAEFDAASYKTDTSDAAPFPETVQVVAPDADLQVLAAAVARGRIVGGAVNMARVLANEPPNVLTPRDFAVRIAKRATEAGLAVDVLEADRIEALRMGLVQAVAQGSAEPPRVIVLRHEPAGTPQSPVLALVGKGVTFDTGGISIKPAENMERMKHDMAGGAAVAAAMCAIAALKVPYRVIAVIPAVENMPGGRAMRPGDVVAGASGKTVEIVNTDAEGRLILADALWYARELGATHLVDVATLAGHCVVGLGRTVSGLMGSPDRWVDQVKATADAAGDRIWPLPIYEEALEQLRSDIADLCNVGGRPGGAITAAAFLREFAGGLPWVHLDIAGTAWAETRTAFQPKGATGVAVRTLTALAMGAAATDRREH
jgi:leucyl aminopeptidase